MRPAAFHMMGYCLFLTATIGSATAHSTVNSLLSLQQDAKAWEATALRQIYHHAAIITASKPLAVASSSTTRRTLAVLPGLIRPAVVGTAAALARAGTAALAGARALPGAAPTTVAASTAVVPIIQLTMPQRCVVFVVTSLLLERQVLSRLMKGSRVLDRSTRATESQPFARTAAYHAAIVCCAMATVLVVIALGILLLAAYHRRHELASGKVHAFGQQVLLDEHVERHGRAVRHVVREAVVALEGPAALPEIEETADQKSTIPESLTTTPTSIRARIADFQPRRADQRSRGDLEEGNQQSPADQRRSAEEKGANYAVQRKQYAQLLAHTRVSYEEEEEEEEEEEKPEEEDAEAEEKGSERIIVSLVRSPSSRGASGWTERRPTRPSRTSWPCNFPTSPTAISWVRTSSPTRPPVPSLASMPSTKAGQWRRSSRRPSRESWEEVMGRFRPKSWPKATSLPPSPHAVHAIATCNEAIENEATSDQKRANPEPWTTAPTTLYGMNGDGMNDDGTTRMGERQFYSLEEQGLASGARSSSWATDWVLSAASPAPAEPTTRPAAMSLDLTV